MCVCSHARMGGRDGRDVGGWEGKLCVLKVSHSQALRTKSGLGSWLGEALRRFSLRWQCWSTGLERHGEHKEGGRLFECFLLTLICLFFSPVVLFSTWGFNMPYIYFYFWFVFCCRFLFWHEMEVWRIHDVAQCFSFIPVVNCSTPVKHFNPTQPLPVFSACLQRGDWIGSLKSFQKRHLLCSRAALIALLFKLLLIISNFSIQLRTRRMLFQAVLGSSTMSSLLATVLDLASQKFGLIHKDRR